MLEYLLETLLVTLCNELILALRDRQKELIFNYYLLCLLTLLSTHNSSNFIIATPGLLDEVCSVRFADCSGLTGICDRHQVGNIRQEAVVAGTFLLGRLVLHALRS